MICGPELAGSPCPCSDLILAANPRFCSHYRQEVVCACTCSRCDPVPLGQEGDMESGVGRINYSCSLKLRTLVGSEQQPSSAVRRALGSLQSGCWSSAVWKLALHKCTVTAGPRGPARPRLLRLMSTEARCHANPRGSGSPPGKTSARAGCSARSV